MCPFRRSCSLNPFVAWVVLACVLMKVEPSVAQEAKEQGIPMLGPGLALVGGESGEQGCLPRTVSQELLRSAVSRANRSLGLDPDFAVVLTLEVPTCTDIFYVHVKNDVEGIGHDHIYPEEIFDFAADTRLQGIAFLNDAPYYGSREEELERAFLHEMGHRWGARVHVSGEDPGALLGRDGEHWSYFLDTSSDGGVSPLEGNGWTANDGDFQSSTHLGGAHFSDLDLYLMGLVPAEEVAPLHLVVPKMEPTQGSDGVEDEDQPSDCRGGVIRAASPPQRCESMEITGTERVISIDEIIAVEGERNPPALAENELPLVASIGFYIFSSGTVAWSAEDCRAWSLRSQRLLDSFAEATGDRMLFENVTQGSATCDELSASIPVPPSQEAFSDPQGCSLVAPSGRVGGGWALLVLLVGWAIATRRANRRRSVARG